MNDRFNRIAYAGSTNVRFCIRTPIAAYADMIGPMTAIGTEKKIVAPQQLRQESRVFTDMHPAPSDR